MFQWVDAYTVAALDPRENIHLLSVKDDSEVEVFDLAHVELVYNSSFFKSIETGGNVSRALVRRRCSPLCVWLCSGYTCSHLHYMYKSARLDHF